MPIISVIVPCFNAAPYVEACMDSLCLQTFEDIEILIVDDGSTDGSGALADARAQHDMRVRVLHQPNGGVSAARNTGLDAAQGTYICFVDADDTLTAGALATLYARAAQGFDIVSARHCEVYADGTRRVFAPGKRCARRAQILARLIEGDSVYNSMCNKLYRRALLDHWRIRAQEGLRIGEDALFNLEAYAHAEHVVHIAAVTYEYRIRDRSAMRSIDQHQHYLQHLPWLHGMRALLARLGLRETFFRSYCYSHILRLYKERGFRGVVRDFDQEVRPAALEGIDAHALPPRARPLYAIVRAGLFPPCYCFIYPAQRAYRAIQKMRRYARHYAERLLRKSKGEAASCS